MMKLKVNPKNVMMMNNNWTEEMWVEQSNDGNDFRTNKSTMYVKQQSKIKFIHSQFTVFSIFI